MTDIEMLGSPEVADTDSRDASPLLVGHDGPEFDSNTRLSTTEEPNNVPTYHNIVRSAAKNDNNESNNAARKHRS